MKKRPKIDKDIVFTVLVFGTLGSFIGAAVAIIMKNLH